MWFIATEAIRAYNIEGSATLRLTPGRYAFLATLLEPLSQRYTAFNQAVLDLHSDQSLVLDARSAGPLEALRPRPAARPIARHFVMSQMTDLGIGFGYFFQGPVDWKMATQSFGATDPKFVSLFNMRWLDAQGSYYAAAWPQRGSLVSGPKAVELDKAAIVHATYGGAFLSGTTAEYSISAALPDIVGGGTLGSGVMLPQSRVEIYYTPESTLRWSSSLDVPLDSSNHLALQSEAVQLQAGHRYTARWNEPPFAPLLAGEVGSGNRAIRAGDTMIFTTQMFGDRGGHLGSVANNLPRYQLYANGQKLGEANGDTFVISVPKDRAAYTLIASAAQSSYRLSSSVTAEWQFESEHAEGAYATLPLLSLQLQPVLNSQGAAHRGVPFVIPIQTQESAHIRELFAEASFDEGKSWSRVAVVGRGAHWQALLKHPAKGDFASLRMTATDLNDNRLRETVIRAYALSD